MAEINVMTKRGMRTVRVSDDASMEDMERAANAAKFLIEKESERATEISPYITAKTGELFSPEELERQRETGEEAFAGMARGPLTLLEGAGQLTGFLAGASPSEMRAYTRQIAKVRRGESFLGQYGEMKPGIEAAISEVTAAMLGTPTVKSATWLGAMGKNALASASGESLLYDPDAAKLADKAPDAMFAGAMGLSISSLLAIPQAHKNYLARQFERADKLNPKARAISRMGEEHLPGGFSLGQFTGVPYIIALENLAFSSKSAGFMRDQAADTVSRFVLRMANAVDPATGRGISSVKAAASDALDSLNAGKSAYRTGVDDAVMRAGDTPQKIQITGTVKAADNLLNVNFDILTKGDFGHPLRVLRDELNLYSQAGRANGLSIREFGELARNVEDMGHELDRLVMTQRFSQDQADRIHGALREGLATDIQATKQLASQGVPFAAPLRHAMNILEETRAAYKINRDMYRAAEFSAVQRMFGADTPISPDGMIERFSGFSLTDQSKIAAFAREKAPDVLSMLQAAAFRRAYLAGAKLDSAIDYPAAGPDVDLNKFDRALFKAPSEEMPGLTPDSPLWNAEQKKILSQVFAALRTIANAPHPFGGTRGAVTAGEVTPVLVSMHPVFAARVMSRIAQHTLAPDIFFDPRVYKSILRVANTSGYAQWSARAALTSVLNTEYGIQIEDDENEQSTGAGQGQ